MVHGITKEVTKLGLSIIEEELKSYDQLLRERQDLCKGCYIERRDETKRSPALVKSGIIKHTFITKKQENTVIFWASSGGWKNIPGFEDAEARIREEAVESNYRKAESMPVSENRKLVKKQ